MVAPEVSNLLPEDLRCLRLPAWLVKSAESECRKPAAQHLPRPRLSRTLRLDPHHLPREIAARWPNPIKASTELDRDFDDAPRFPIQLAHFLRGAARFATRARLA